VPPRRLSIKEAQNTLGDVAPQLASGAGTELVIEVAGTRGITLVSTDRYEGLIETLEIMSDIEMRDQLRNADMALQSGNFIKQVDFEREYGLSPVNGRWKLVVSGPAHKSVLNVPAMSSRNRILEFVLGPLVDNPEGLGLELVGDLARRYKATVGDYRVIYRFEPFQQVVRLVDVLRGDYFHVGR
jgi:mRNA-degrading endonuclease RelE of RelBE toxin-antitoxin system